MAIGLAHCNLQSTTVTNQHLIAKHNCFCIVIAGSAGEERTAEQWFTYECASTCILREISEWEENIPVYRNKKSCECPTRLLRHLQVINK